MALFHQDDNSEALVEVRSTYARREGHYARWHSAATVELSNRAAENARAAAASETRRYRISLILSGIAIIISLFAYFRPIPAEPQVSTPTQAGTS